MTSRQALGDRARAANLLGALSTALQERSAVPLGTHPNQSSTATAALKLVSEAPGCSNAQLAAALSLSHSSTVRLLNRLVDGGLVERRAATDGRAVALHPTPAGQRRVEAALASRRAAMQDVLRRLDSEDVAHLERIAATLLESATTSPVAGAHLCRLCDQPSCPQDQCPVHRRAQALAAGTRPT
ncbi:MarR family winged helix-turn-helix transcriptional regulator [Paraconexibacter antarcticus]|uniref:MarR family winged helix-turn-helix transcriptional regulator n=1 Tax=Paraconexibacter antarcticus TaxID=2949664 RepID=UPI00345F5530